MRDDSEPCFLQSLILDEAHQLFQVLEEAVLVGIGRLKLGRDLSGHGTHDSNLNLPMLLYRIMASTTPFRRVR